MCTISNQTWSSDNVGPLVVDRGEEITKLQKRMAGEPETQNIIGASEDMPEEVTEIDEIAMREHNSGFRLC